VVLALLAFGAYLFAPQIAERVPAAAPLLESYVAWVNEIRPQLNTAVDGVIARIQALIGSVTGGGEG
jgi:hypothetical protein